MLFAVRHRAAERLTRFRTEARFATAGDGCEWSAPPPGLLPGLMTTQPGIAYRNPALSTRHTDWRQTIPVTKNSPPRPESAGRIHPLTRCACRPASSVVELVVVIHVFHDLLHRLENQRLHPLLRAGLGRFGPLP
ncbi:MAG: hypothetical protein KatS3mg004_0167 [Bryobacteraceae bacterium]|nr:MAG: hypothetical protein KatS3mg004_0167 [Bryobacteraceae bacterium]